MKKIIVYIMIGTLSVLLMWQVFGLKNGDSAAQKNIEALDAACNNIIPDFTGTVIDNYPDNNLELYTGERNSFKSINEMTDSVLFIRVSAGGCKACFDMLVDNLGKIKLNHKNLNYVILMRDVPLRDMMVLQKQMSGLFAFYRIDNLNLDFQSAYNPILFTLSKNGEVKTFHLCDKDNWSDTEQYFSELFKQPV